MTRYIVATLLLLGYFHSGQAEEQDASVDIVETFYQEVDVRRSPRFVVQGVSVAQQIHYQIRSSFEVASPDKKGNFKAVQTVENATLLEADALSQAVFTQSLADLIGQKYSYQFDRNHEIIAMTGHESNTEIIEVKAPNSTGTLVSTVIDEDGWKELAQLTLFRPLDQRSPNDPFVRKAEHDWGSLGSWYGKTTFTRTGSQRAVTNYRYQHQLEYTKPNGPGDLPFAIVDAKFQAYEAGGIIVFDAKAKHVHRVQERFQAKGTVETTMLGVAATIAIDEQQEFIINVVGYQRKTK